MPQVATMGAAEPSAVESSGLLDRLLRSQRQAFARDMNPTHAMRLDRLARLERLLDADAEREFAAAISQDFGNRSRVETVLAEVLFTRTAIKQARRHLKAWMKPRRVPTAMTYLPGRSRLLRQPLGVIGIISPWNYPLQLALAPLVGALAAGNRAMLKPSELTPRLSEVLRRRIAEVFAEDEVAVVVGDADVGKAFSALPFDHLVFTGSTAVGRIVAQAAAKNLTPVTLELGGKSPAIIDASADPARIAERIAFGKLLNAGQTCIAPDYVLVHRSQRDALVAALTRAARQMYGERADNPDYTAIINATHYARLQSLVDEAVQMGARAVTPTFQASGAGTRKFPPTLLLDTQPGMRVMQEEIFGPVLPVVTYDGDVGEAIAYINARDKPLALYWYGRDARSRDRVIEGTVSGGVTVNDCIWHFAQESQPFGGVGASGMGAYHGEWGFRAFSKEKPVFQQARLNGMGLLYPPYGKTFERMVRLLKAIS